MFDLQWYDWIGLLGTLMVLAAYFLLQAGRLRGNGVPCQLLNLFGAAGVLVSLLYGKLNFVVLVLMLAWIAITIYGLVRTFRGDGPAKPPAA